MRDVPRAALRELGVAAVMLVAAVYATWPLSRHLATRVPGDLGDPLENAWIFGWGAHGIIEQPRGLFHANMFFPSRYSLAFAENMLGLSVPVAPITWVSDNPVLAVNVATLLVFAVTGWAVHRLVTVLTGHVGVGMVAGVAFTTLPYRVAAVAHVHVLAIHLLPLVVLAVVRLARTERATWRHALAVALLLGAQLWGSLTGGMLTLAATGLAFLWALAVRPKRARQITAAVAVGVVGGVVLAAPIFLAYREARAANPGYGHPSIEVVQNSATPASYAYPTAGGPVVDGLYARLARATKPEYTGQEKTLFPGVVLSAALALALAGAVVMFVRRRGQLAAAGLSLALAAGGFVLSLGPRLGAREDGFPLPFAIVEAVVPGGLTRVPARFGILAILGLICAMGVVVAQLGDRVRRGVVAVLVAALAVEAWPSQVHTVQVPSRTTAHRGLAGTERRVLALPTLEFTPGGGLVFPSVPLEAIHLWYSTANFRPLVNGYGAFLPEPYGQTAKLVQTFPDDPSITHLRELGVDTVLVESRLVPGTPWTDVSAQLAQWPGARLVTRAESTEVWDISGA